MEQAGYVTAWFPREVRLRVEEGNPSSSGTDTSGLAGITELENLERGHASLMQDLAVLVR